jgi:CRISPR-associated protein Cas2
MRNVYLVCYDVSDDKRLRRAYKMMKGYGDPLQYSVFRCELSPAQRQRMKEDLWDLLNFACDRVMIVDLGPAGARGRNCVEFWGEPRTQPRKREAMVA